MSTALKRLGYRTDMVNYSFRSYHPETKEQHELLLRSRLQFPKGSTVRSINTGFIGEVCDVIRLGLHYTTDSERLRGQDRIYNRHLHASAMALVKWEHTTEWYIHNPELIADFCYINCDYLSVVND